MTGTGCAYSSKNLHEILLGLQSNGCRMHGFMHHLHCRHPLCGGRCSSFFPLENSSRQEFCRILKGSSEEESHYTVTKHHSFMQAEAKVPSDIDSLSLQEHHRPIRRPREHFLDGKQVVFDILIGSLGKVM